MFAVCYQKPGIYFSRIGMLIDQGIKIGLGKLGLIAFVMPVPAVTQYIYINIFVELLPESGSNFSRFDYRFYIVSIDMKYRRLGNTGNRSTIVRASCVFLICRKTNLIIDDEMNGASYIVSLQLTHLGSFIDNALRCNRCISVYKNG